MKKIKAFVKRITLTKNITLKIVSVVFAVILWLLIMDYENPDMSKTVNNVPVQYIGVDQLEARKLYAESPLDATVNVTVSGRRKDVLELDPNNIVASVDLTSVQSGSYDLPLAVSTEDDSVVIQGYNQSAINVVIDDIIVKRLTVEAFSNGELTSPYQLLSVDLTPQTVNVKGPSKLLGTIDKAILPFSLKKITSSYSLYNDLEVLNTKGDIMKDLNLSATKIHAKINVGLEKTVPINAQWQAPADESLKRVRQSLSKNEATILGEVSVVNSIEALNTAQIAALDAPGMRSGEITLEVPDGIEVLSPKSLMATVEYDLHQIKQIQLSDYQVVWQNEPTGFSAKLVNAETTFELPIEGLKKVLDNADFSQSQVIINLDGLTLGIQEVPYRIVLPEGVKANDTSQLIGSIDVELY